jgi:hypothetical protein
MRGLDADSSEDQRANRKIIDIKTDLREIRG